MLHWTLYSNWKYKPCQSYVTRNCICKIDVNCTVFSKFKKIMQYGKQFNKYGLSCKHARLRRNSKSMNYLLPVWHYISHIRVEYFTSSGLHNLLFHFLNRCFPKTQYRLHVSMLPFLCYLSFSLSIFNIYCCITNIYICMFCIYIMMT